MSPHAEPLHHSATFTKDSRVDIKKLDIEIQWLPNGWVIDILLWLSAMPLIHHNVKHISSA